MITQWLSFICSVHCPGSVRLIPRGAIKYLYFHAQSPHIRELCDKVFPLLVIYIIGHHSIMEMQIGGVSMSETGFLN